MAATPPDVRILTALEEVLAEEGEWNAGQGVVDALRAVLEPMGIETLAIHNVLRLIGAGGQEVVSQSSGKMFATLGREEWRHRLQSVQKLM